ncbi:MAG TPA: biotin--[acetyl-CoA-carboxylase] ligase [bacterium]|nr:biotin--[acetyl-CoA-carboxylase] ligase [bacterium]
MTARPAGEAFDALADELRRLPARLRTSVLGRTLHVLARAASTNDVARALAEEGAPDGTTVIALQQTAGRGRRGRSWISPRGGLYLSVVLYPRLAPAQWPLISLAAAVGVAEGIAAAGGPAVALKWPNDVMLAGRKAGGILLETGARASGVRFAILGVGVNAAGGQGHVARLPDEAAVVDLPLSVLAKAVLENLEMALVALAADPAAIRDRWRAYSETLGRRVQVIPAVGGPTAGALAGAFEGVAEDVDAQGALLVRTADGLRRVLAGDVTLR